MLKAQKIQQKIKKLHFELKQCQDECLHPNVKKTHGANTGNYDPSCDKYWTDFDCPDCLKKWSKEGSL